MTTLFVVLFALVGLAVVGFAALLVHADHVIKTTPARLAALPCPSCGVAIGADAAAGIAERRAKEASCLHAEARQKGIRLRVSPYWFFACPACGAALKFDPDARGQQLTADDATSRTFARPEPP